VFVKVLSAGALAFAPVPAPVYIDYPLVEQVRCAEGTGTAFTAAGRIVSVHHVTRLTNCSINGVPLDAAQEGDKDFSTAPASIAGYRINCEGFKEGEPYWATGYAEGGPDRLISLVGTGEYHANGMAVLLGWPTVIPGMSGGAIYDRHGTIVGTINMYSTIYPLSFSVELKGTSLCSAVQ
jgi:hypothetical protein